MEFYQTVGGRQFVDSTIPNLVNELHELQEQMKQLNKNIVSTIETTSVEVYNNFQVSEIINSYSAKGWAYKNYIPERDDAAAVLVFERKVGGNK